VKQWELDFKWLELQHKLKDHLKREELPSLNSILYLIGIQELGQIRSSFNKEEKRDLFHIAVCRLMSFDGYYEYLGLDDEGWPHWKNVKSPPLDGSKAQEEYLKSKIIEYFKIIDF